MPDNSLTDYSNALNSAVGLAQFIMGSNTTTNTVTNGSGTTDVATSVEASSNTKLGADPDVIAALKTLAGTAVSNSTDNNQVRDLLAGILQKAGDAMSTVFGKQSQAGLYNSSSTASQNSDIMARAAADAATAILGYKTTQQTLAGTTYNQLANITQTKSDIAKTNTTSHAAVVNNSTNTQTTEKAGVSMVCTFMHRNKLLDSKRYVTSTKDFIKRPWYVKSGYLVIARPLVTLLEKNHTTFLAGLIMWIFAARTEYICSKYKLPGCTRKLSGCLAANLVICACFFPAVWLIFKSYFVSIYYTNEEV
jgi:hypothetical protein